MIDFRIILQDLYKQRKISLEMANRVYEAYLEEFGKPYSACPKCYKHILGCVTPYKQLVRVEEQDCEFYSVSSLCYRGD